MAFYAYGGLADIDQAAGLLVELDNSQGSARASALFGGGQEAAKQVPLAVGEVGFVRGDFHRLHSAAANQSRQNSQSNQVICAFFYSKQTLSAAAGTSWIVNRSYRE